MTPQGSPRQGGGRRVTAVALGVVALIGAALLIFALTNQVGDPPQPELRSSASDSGGTDPAEIPSLDAAEPTENSEASDGLSVMPSTAAAEPSEDPTTSEAAAPEATGAEATGAAAGPLERSEPTSMTIPSIGVDEELFPIGLGENGELLAPRGDRANQPAWFEGSPTPGETGPAVIEGHVTWGGDPSVFFELGGLTTGDQIDVERADGTTATFEVYDSARYAKDQFPTLDVYGATDDPELRVITCGGDLGTDGHHLDNTVIFARLAQP